MRSALVALAAGSVGAHAADLYGVQVTVDQITNAAGYKSASDALASLSAAQLSRINPAYSGVETTNIALNFRGLPITASYPVNGGSQLVFAVPSLGITQTFNGGTRDASQQQFEDYIKKNGAGILDQMLRALAQVSPVDPIAGNPNSLMSQMVSNDFFVGSSPVADKKDDGGTSNLIGIGARVGSFSAGGYRSNSVTIPLSYTFRADLDPRRQVGLYFPISYTTVSGARVYSVSPGLSYRQPLTDDWSLTPAVGVGLTGSTDMASVAGMGSGSLTSRYVSNFAGHDFTLSNMVGFYRTLKLAAGSYSSDPAIHNTVAKNGLAVSQPVSLLGGSSIELSYANTHFWGTNLYAMNYHEVGISVGTNRSARSARSYFKTSLNLLYAGNAKGASVNLGYWF